jgi:hypothetical protein
VQPLNTYISYSFSAGPRSKTLRFCAPSFASSSVAASRLPLAQVRPTRTCDSASSSAEQSGIQCPHLERPPSRVFSLRGEAAVVETDPKRSSVQIPTTKPVRSFESASFVLRMIRQIAGKKTTSNNLETHTQIEHPFFIRHNPLRDWSLRFVGEPMETLGEAVEEAPL